MTYGRRLFMEQGETVVTDDPDEIDERDYYTLAYAEKEGLEVEQATAAFETDDEAGTDETTADGEPVTDGGERRALERAGGRDGSDRGGNR